MRTQRWEVINTESKQYAKNLMKLQGHDLLAFNAEDTLHNAYFFAIDEKNYKLAMQLLPPIFIMEMVQSMRLNLDEISVLAHGHKFLDVSSLRCFIHPYDFPSLKQLILDPSVNHQNDYYFKLAELSPQIVWDCREAELIDGKDDFLECFHTQ